MYIQNFIFLCGGENKKHSVCRGGVAKDPGPLQYRPYDFGYLSKWFVFVFMIKFWAFNSLVNGRPTVS